MEHCKTCAHWTNRDGWEQAKDGMKKCARIIEKWVVEDRVPQAIVKAYRAARIASLSPWPECEKADLQTAEAAYDAATGVVFNDAKACVVDGSPYVAELLTRPDFGCVLWKAKD